MMVGLSREWKVHGEREGGADLCKWMLKQKLGYQVVMGDQYL